MSTAKNAVFIGLQLENCCLVGVIFLGGARMSKFGLVGARSSKKNSLMFYFWVYMTQHCLYDSAKTACFGKMFLKLYTKMFSANKIARFFKF